MIKYCTAIIQYNCKFLVGKWKIFKWNVGIYFIHMYKSSLCHIRRKCRSTINCWETQVRPSFESVSLLSLLQPVTTSPSRHRSCGPFHCLKLSTHLFYRMEIGLLQRKYALSRSVGLWNCISIIGDIRYTLHCL